MTRESGDLPVAVVLRPAGVCRKKRVRPDDDVLSVVPRPVMPPPARPAIPLPRRAFVAGMAAAALSPHPVAAAARPGRIVSLNACLDVILMRLVGRERIAALSRYSRDRYGSTIADEARTLPFTRGTTEEVAALRPDLVLGDQWGGERIAASLARLHIRVERFDVPATLAASLDQVRRVAAVVGEPARGEALVRTIEATLRQSAPPPGRRPVSTLVFMPGGFVSGPGTLMDEMMTRMGLSNAAARYGLSGSAMLPLEQLIADPPELLLTGQPWPGSPGWAERTMEHPALDRLSPRMRRAVFPERLLFCGGPVLMQTARTLAAARRSVEARA